MKCTGQQDRPLAAKDFAIGEVNNGGNLGRSDPRRIAPSFDGARIAPKSQGHRSKLAPSLQQVINASGLVDSGTISFHHHRRNGDQVLNLVVREPGRIGIQGLHIAASAIFPVHADLIEHLQSSAFTRLNSAYIAGPVADAISRGQLRHPAIMQTHDGGARAIAAGTLPINMAFIVAPTRTRVWQYQQIDRSLRWAMRWSMPIMPVM